MDNTIISLLVILSIANANELPNDIPKCSIGDEKCLTSSTSYVIKHHATTGLKQLGLVQLDPLHIKTFSIGRNPTSPVSIDLTFTNADLIGLKDAKIKHISTFTRDLSRPITLDLVAPRLTLKGPYRVDGKVLILPIVGEGIAQIDLVDCLVHAVVKLRPVEKGLHQTYAEVLEVKLQLDPKQVTYRLQGLFGGRKDLSDSLHALVNENWKEIFNELKPDIASGMGLIFKAVINRALSKLPIELLFSDV